MQRLIGLSDDFISKLVQLTSGSLSSTQLDELINLFEKEISLHFFTRDSESNLLRIIQYQFDKTVLLKECLKYPHHIEILVSIASNSNYLSDILVRNPEYFHLLTNPDKLVPTSPKYFVENIKKSIEQYQSFNSKVNAIRNFKRREILKIGLMDIYLKEGIQSVYSQLTHLANSLTSELFELCYKSVLSKYDILKPRNKYCLIALGKLGGNELNYSSDIDLIIFSDKNSFIKKKYFFNDLLSETIKLFIENASAVTANGFLYRVDFRLRPDGRNAALTGSMNEYFQYYETRGDDWERQMLIKTGFVSGNHNLYNKFIKYLSPFIYQSSYNTSPLQQITKLKKSVEANLDDDNNIKLSKGGIRDIEFSVQALQLINGYKYFEIRTVNTLEAITKLEELNLLRSKEATIFRESYILYRKIEHYLQLMNNIQTHSIPADGEQLEKLSLYLGFSGSAEFNRAIQLSKQNVRKIYLSIVDDEDESSSITFSNVKFIDKNRAEKNIEFLKTGRGVIGTKGFDNRTTIAFNSISLNLESYLIKCVTPDKTLDNLTRIIKTATLPVLWYKEFQDENFVFDVLKICEFSQYSVELCAEDKSIRDLLLSRKCFSKLDESSILTLKLKEILFVLSVQFCLKIIDAKETRNILSTFIRHQIANIYRSFASDRNWGNNFLILGMGSFGTNSLTFVSDIDLIFLVKDISHFQNIQSEWQLLLNQLKSQLAPFEVDCRLRPEGKSSQLVWDIDEYKNYIQKRARVWEHQAFLKSSVIIGNPDHYDELVLCISKTVKQIPEANLKDELLEMRKKFISNDIIPGSLNIKKSSGLLTDIEYVFSYFQLCNSELILNLIEKKKSETLLKRDEKLKQLVTHYDKLKEIEMANQIIFDTKISRLSFSEDKLSLVAKFLGYKDSNSLKQTIVKIQKSITNIFQKVFEIKK